MLNLQMVLMYWIQLPRTSPVSGVMEESGKLCFIEEKKKKKPGKKKALLESVLDDIK